MPCAKCKGIFQTKQANHNKGLNPSFIKTSIGCLWASPWSFEEDENFL